MFNLDKNQQKVTNQVCSNYTTFINTLIKMLSEKTYSIWCAVTFASPNRKQRNRQYIVNLIQVQSKKTLRNYKKCLMQWENPFQFSPMKICMGKCSPHNNPQLRLFISYWLTPSFILFEYGLLIFYTINHLI